MTHPDYIITRLSLNEWSVWKEEWNEKEESFPLPYRIVRVTKRNERSGWKYLCNCPHFQIRLRQSSDCKHIEMAKEGAWNERDFERR